MLGGAIPLGVLIGHGIKGPHRDVSRRMEVTRRPSILKCPLDRTFRVLMSVLVELSLNCIGRRAVSRGGWLSPRERSTDVANYIYETLANANLLRITTHKFLGPRVKNLYFH